VNGDIVHTANNEYHFYNATWIMSYTYRGDYLSQTEVSGWTKVFTLQKNTDVYARKNILLAISSSYYNGTSSTFLVGIPYGGNSAPYLISHGKNHSETISLAYEYDANNLYIYINSGNWRRYSLKLLQCDVPSNQWNFNENVYSILPATASIFFTL
jgi:hypothetical protein